MSMLKIKKMGSLSAFSLMAQIHTLKLLMRKKKLGISMTICDIGLFGYDFPKWSVCDNLETTIDILKEFIESGEKLPTVSWREDW